MHQLKVFAAMAAALAFASPAAATQVISTEVFASINGSGIASGHHDSWQTPADFADHRNMHVENSFDIADDRGASIFVSTETTAKWNSINDGRIDIVSNMIVNRPIDSNLFEDYTARWEFQFTADEDGVLNLDFKSTLIGQDNEIGLWTVFAGDKRNNSDFVLFLPEGYNGGDTLTYNASLRLQAGHSYFLGLEDFGASNLDDRRGFIGGLESGSLNWKIVPDAPAGGVPEPASWALMIAGFALMGGRLRRAKSSSGLIVG